MSRAAAKVRAEKSRAAPAPAPALPPPPSPTHHVETASILPVHLTKSELMNMVEQEDGEEVVAELLDELMCRVLEKCYQVYLQRQLVPFTLFWAQHSLVQTLKWQLLERDDGDGHDTSPFWEEDSEPLHCEIDSWAQGCVPVVHSRPRPKHIYLQRSVELPMEDAVNPSSPPPKNVSQSERKECNSDRDPCKEDKNQNVCRRHEGLKSRMLIPCPPSKKGDKKHPMPHLPEIRAPQDRNSSCVSRGPVSHSINKEEHPIPKDQTMYVSKCKHAKKHSDLSTVKRVDAARLVRHQVLPGFEVLDSHVPQISIGKSTVPPILCQNQDKHNTKLPAALKQPTNYRMPHKVCHRSKIDGALWLSSRMRNIQNVDQSLGPMPLSAGLLMDTMVLSPGVTLKDPRQVHTSTLSQTGQRANLKPIRSSLPTPLFSKDQLMPG